MSTKMVLPANERAEGVYYHMVNDTVRTDAILRAARAMRWRAFRSALPMILTAPGRLFDQMTAGLGTRAPTARGRQS
ncbi:MAG: hypothetical protein H6842_08045 [Rhodospirillaceae bacterium]|nr:hypothetical protein [Rhodospirillaceae bacterium]